jgi:hypothetical protein
LLGGQDGRKQVQEFLALPAQFAGCFGYRDIGSDPQPGRVPDRIGGAVAARACFDFKNHRLRNHNLGGQGFDQIEPLDASQSYQR